MEALHDPYFQQFVVDGAPPTTVLMEVKEFRRYSTDLNAAWDLVERFSDRSEPLQVRCEGRRWVAAFGPRQATEAATAPIAICLAALRAKGVNVECEFDELEAGLPCALASDRATLK